MAKLNNYKKISFLISGGGSNLIKILKKNSINKDFEVGSIISNNSISKKITSYVNKYYKNVLVMEYQRSLQKKKLFEFRYYLFSRIYESYRKKYYRKF